MAAGPGSRSSSPAPPAPPPSACAATFASCPLRRSSSSATPISAYRFYLTITNDQIRSWISWANTHFVFGTINVFPAIIWRACQPTVMPIELSRWAVVFFTFFGFAAEARKNYHLAS
ncbi:Mating type pheromone receptor 3 [Mycena venus]|uniref:Mating type pheromone receptor 3 n=1 Tax=Mycena venus TaxID=2733690 RepID=A0A8H7CRD9_9AGAR|nr:Mating type pheromone receptor 3 [Mycena venus]